VTLYEVNLLELSLRPQRVLYGKPRIVGLTCRTPCEVDLKSVMCRFE
jgi:hypothetical protein